MLFPIRSTLFSSGLKALAIGTAVASLTFTLAGAAFSQTITSGQNSQSKGDSDVFTITNDTLAQAAASSLSSSVAPDVSISKQRPASSSGHCLPLAQLNEEGARAADLAQQYFLKELDLLAKDHDLATADGWLNAAPKMNALASRISSEAGQVRDDEARKMLFDFADDIQETASWVASRPTESAEKFQRGEAIFSRRF